MKSVGVRCGRVVWACGVGVWRGREVCVKEERVRRDVFTWHGNPHNHTNLEERIVKK